jgi:hypothetical protein
MAAGEPETEMLGGGVDVVALAVTPDEYQPQFSEKIL